MKYTVRANPVKDTTVTFVVQPQGYAEQAESIRISHAALLIKDAEELIKNEIVKVFNVKKEEIELEF